MSRAGGGEGAESPCAPAWQPAGPRAAARGWGRKRRYDKRGREACGGCNRTPRRRVRAHTHTGGAAASRAGRAGAGRRARPLEARRLSSEQEQPRARTGGWEGGSCEPRTRRLSPLKGATPPLPLPNTTPTTAAASRGAVVRGQAAQGVGPNSTTTQTTASGRACVRSRAQCARGAPSGPLGWVLHPSQRRLARPASSIETV